MIQIEYNGKKVIVPESWDEITLGLYETFYTDKPTNAHEQIILVAKVCGTDHNTLLEWPVEIFNRIVEYIGFIFKDNAADACPYVEIEGNKYIVNIEERLSLGEWVDCDEVQNRGENILSNTLSIVCRPAGEKYDFKNNEARRELFAALPVSKVLGVLAFFLRCKNEYDKRTEAYSKLMQAVDLLPKDIKTLLKNGGGIRLLLTWRGIKYYVLMKLLYFRLRRSLHSLNTEKTKRKPKKRKGNSMKT
jgi:hypothetical protein